MVQPGTRLILPSAWCSAQEEPTLGGWEYIITSGQGTALQWSHPCGGDQPSPQGTDLGPPEGRDPALPQGAIAPRHRAGATAGHSPSIASRWGELSIVPGRGPGATSDPGPSSAPGHGSSVALGQGPGAASGHGSSLAPVAVPVPPQGTDPPWPRARSRCRLGRARGGKTLPARAGGGARQPEGAWSARSRPLSRRSGRKGRGPVRRARAWPYGSRAGALVSRRRRLRRRPRPEGLGGWSRGPDGAGDGMVAP